MTLPPPAHQDTLRECAREDKHCLSYLPALSPVYFVTFVLVAQFVLVNVVVAVLMKHLEESNKEAREDAEMDAEIELEMAQGSAAQPPSVAQVRLLRGPGGSQGFWGAAELTSSFPHHRKARGPSQALQTSWWCAKCLCPGCSPCPMTATCSGPWLPPSSRTLCRKWRWRPTLVVSLWVWTPAGQQGNGTGRGGWAGGKLDSMSGRARGQVVARSSGHTVQMHPYPRPSHLCSLTASGAPCLLPGPINCVLPSQGQRSPSCPFTPRYTPLSEPLTDPLQTGKGNFHPTGLWGSPGFLYPIQSVSEAETQENECYIHVFLDLEFSISAEWVSRPPPGDSV